MAGLKERIKLLDKTANEIATMIGEYEAIIPDGFKYVTDRLNITVAEIRNMSEALTQHGELDEELVTALDALCIDY